MSIKRITGIISAITVASSAFVCISVPANAKITETNLTYVTEDGAAFDKFDCNSSKSVRLSLDENSQAALKTASSNNSAELTLSYTLAGGSYRKGTNAANDRYRSVITVAGKTFYFNAGNTANDNNFPNNIGDYYINFWSNNKITVTYTLTLNDECKATAINFKATGTTRTDNTIDLSSSPAPVNEIILTSNLRSADYTDQGALLQDLTAIITTEAYAQAEVSALEGMPYIYYDEDTQEAKEAASYNSIPDSAKVISKGAVFTVTPNDDIVTKVTVTCSDTSAKAENGDGVGTNSTSLETTLSDYGSIRFGILDYTTDGKGSIPDTSNVWQVSIETSQSTAAAE